MSLSLACDQCAKRAEVLNEIRVVSVSRSQTYTFHGEYVVAQLHWECIVPFVNRRDAEDKEVPF